MHLRLHGILALLAVALGCGPESRHAVVPEAPTGTSPLAHLAARPASLPEPEPAHPTSDPYTGDLSIFEQPGRAERLQIDRVMDLLAIHEGSAVADLGAGSGWFTVRAARRVGGRGTVYAIEINRAYLDHIAERAEREHLANVRTVLGTEDDPRLPAGSVDAVLLLKTYHELSAPLAVMRRLRAAMRPSGRLGIIDKNGRGDDHGLDRDVVVREVEAAGFALADQYDFVKPEKLDYFLVFAPRTVP